MREAEAVLERLHCRSRSSKDGSYFWNAFRIVKATAARGGEHRSWRNKHNRSSASAGVDTPQTSNNFLSSPNLNHHKLLNQHPGPQDTAAGCCCCWGWRAIAAALCEQWRGGGFSPRSAIYLTLFDADAKPVNSNSSQSPELLPLQPTVQSDILRDISHNKPYLLPLIWRNALVIGALASVQRHQHVTVGGKEPLLGIPRISDRWFIGFLVKIRESCSRIDDDM